MKKDIIRPDVKNVAIAIVQDENELAEKTWNVYLINKKEMAITNVLISSKGYKKDDMGELTETSVLRHFFEKVEPKNFVKVEPIIEEVFGLNNEYFLTFYINSELYDKKYIFLSETIKEEYFVKVPFIEKLGVMIE